MGVAASTTEPAEDAKPAKCGANGRTGKPCGRPAGWGTDHVGWGACKLHAGSTANGRRHAARLQIEAMHARSDFAASVDLGGEHEIDPYAGILEAVYRAARWVRVCATMVGRLTGEELVVVREREVNWKSTGDRGAGTETTTETSAELHIWLRTYRDAFLDYAKLCKLALDAGVEERRVRLAEQQGDELIEMFRLFIDKLGLSERQLVLAPAALEETLRHFEVIPGGLAA